MSIDILLTCNHCPVKSIKITCSIIYPMPTILHPAITCIIDRLFLFWDPHKSCLHRSIISIKIIPVAVNIFLTCNHCPVKGIKITHNIIYFLPTILHLTIVCIIDRLFLFWDPHKSCLHRSIISIKIIPVAVNIFLTCNHCPVKGIKITHDIIYFLPTILHLTVIGVINCLILTIRI